MYYNLTLNPEPHPLTALRTASCCWEGREDVPSVSGTRTSSYPKYAELPAVAAGAHPRTHRVPCAGTCGCPPARPAPDLLAPDAAPRAPRTPPARPSLAPSRHPHLPPPHLRPPSQPRPGDPGSAPRAWARPPPGLSWEEARPAGGRAAGFRRAHAQRAAEESFAAAGGRHSLAAADVGPSRSQGALVGQGPRCRLCDPP